MNALSSSNRELAERIPRWAIVFAVLLGTAGMVYSAVLFTASDMLKNQADSSLNQTADYDQKQLPDPAEGMAVVTSQENINRIESPEERPLSPTRDTGITPLPSASMDSKAQQSHGETPCPPLFTIAFALGSTTPKAPDLTRKLAQLADWLKAHPDAEIIIEGFSSALGGEKTNLLISRQRATAVVRLLSDMGVSSQQLLTRAHGEHRLLEDVPPNSAKNRRVAMKIEGFENCLINANSEDIN